MHSLHSNAGMNERFSFFCKPNWALEIQAKLAQNHTSQHLSTSGSLPCCCTLCSFSHNSPKWHYARPAIFDAQCAVVVWFTVLRHSERLPETLSLPSSLIYLNLFTFISCRGWGHLHVTTDNFSRDYGGKLCKASGWDYSCWLLILFDGWGCCNYLLLMGSITGTRSTQNRGNFPNNI